MRFQENGTELKLDVVGYEFPADGGAPDSDDRNWLVLAAEWKDHGRVTKEKNSCLLTYELRELTAGLKVLCAGVRDSFESAFVEPYLELAAQAEGERFLLDAAFFLERTETEARVECTLSRAELEALIGELEALCARFPDRA